MFWKIKIIRKEQRSHVFLLKWDSVLLFMRESALRPNILIWPFEIKRHTQSKETNERMDKKVILWNKAGIAKFLITRWFCIRPVFLSSNNEPKWFGNQFRFSWVEFDTDITTLKENWQDWCTKRSFGFIAAVFAAEILYRTLIFSWSNATKA